MIKRIYDTVDIWMTYNELYKKGFIRKKPYSLREIWRGVDVLHGNTKG